MMKRFFETIDITDWPIEDIVKKQEELKQTQHKDSYISEQDDKKRLIVYWKEEWNWR